VEDLDAPAQGIREALRAHRHHQELLEVDVGVGVAAAVQDVHHGRGQEACVHSAQIAVERQLQRAGRGARGGHGDGQNGVGAQLRLVLRAVDGDHALVQQTLVGCVHAGQLWGQDALHVLDRVEHALAHVVLLVAVAQLDGLVLSGAGAGGDGGAALGPAGEGDVGFDGGVSAGVQYLAGGN